MTIAMSGVVVFFDWLKSKGDVAEETIFIIGVREEFGPLDCATSKDIDCATKFCNFIGL